MNPVSQESHTSLTNGVRPERDANLGDTIIPLNNPDNVPAIIIDSSPNSDNLTITPAFPNFSTDERITIEPESTVLPESSEQTNKSSLSSATTPISSQRNSQLLDELKYLLKPTNSLANPDSTIQASQEADAAIKRRTSQFDDDTSNNNHRLLIEGLTPAEVKSLGAVERLSIAARGQNSSKRGSASDRLRASSMQPTVYVRSHSQSPSISLTVQPERHTFLNRLSGVFWAFIAAYSFSIILFLTEICGIDLVFGFFLQMIVQTVAFGVYGFYKGYNLLGPPEHRMAMICRAVLIGIGALTSFLAYYYITLPDLSAIRQTQVVLAIIFSIFFLHERVTIARILACILTLIAIIVLIRPTTFRGSSSQGLNSTSDKTSWVPYLSSWNHIIGISLVLCTAIVHSIASTMNRIYVRNQHLHNTILCFWSALFALIISMILVYVTHFILKDSRTFPHDWRLFVGFALALASIFVFIANQKAIKRERSSIVTIIYSTDIILALILQNVFTQIKSDAIVILGCLLILISIVIVCFEVFFMENNKTKLAIKVAEMANTSEQDDSLPKPSILKTQKRLSI